jgi:glutamate racemase
MKISFKVFLPFFLLILMCASCAENPTFAREDSFLNFFRRNEVTIAITDSGLGGLSILADAVERTKNWKSFQKVNFIYFNALFSNQGGYNTLETHKEKVSIFDSALNSLEDRCNPDLILLACNTLSIIYDDTSFSKQTKTPVKGIIDTGVNVAYDALKAHPESKIILFATQTTVAQNSHKNQLLKKGFLPERIVYQACPELARYIEADYKGDFRGLGVEPVAFLNSNSKMNDFLFRSQYQNRFQNTDTSVRIVSMVKISKKKIQSLGTFFQPFSSQTVEALQEYEWEEDLFEWKSLDFVVSFD